MEISQEYIRYYADMKNDWQENHFYNCLPENFKLGKPLSKEEESVLRVYQLQTYILTIVEEHAEAIFKENGINMSGFQFWYTYILHGDNDEVYGMDETEIINYIRKYALYKKNKREEKTQTNNNDIVIKGLEQLFIESKVSIDLFYNLLRKYKFIDENNHYKSMSSKDFNGYIAGFLDGFKQEYKMNCSILEFHKSFAQEFKLSYRRITNRESRAYISMKEIFDPEYQDRLYK